MFQSARVQLTLWYVLILMCISCAFSVAIYSVLTSEVQRVALLQRTRFEGKFRTWDMPARMQMSFSLPVIPTDADLFLESQRRIAVSLFVINGLILLASGWLSYFLAGRTLQPLQKAAQQQKQFITDASHELRTPLTALRTGLEVSLRDAGHLSVSAQAVLEETLDDVIRLQMLSERLLSFGQVEEQKTSLSVSDHSLGELVEEAFLQVRPLAHKKQITFEKKGGDFSVPVVRASFIQLLVILLENAVKYSEKKKEVIVKYRKKNGQVVVQIIDNGFGIAREDQEKIFERFYQVDHSRTRHPSSGFGLGLSLAREIARTHGLQLRVESNLGAGSTFSIIFPRS